MLTIVNLQAHQAVQSALLLVESGRKSAEVQQKK